MFEYDSKPFYEKCTKALLVTSLDYLLDCIDNLCHDSIATTRLGRTCIVSHKLMLFGFSYIRLYCEATVWNNCEIVKEFYMVNKLGNSYVEISRPSRPEAYDACETVISFRSNFRVLCLN